MPNHKFSKKNSKEILPIKESRIRFKKRPFKFTDKQTALINILMNEDTKVVFISGPAGVSKTILTVYAALQMMAEHPEKNLLYVRSIAESADKGLGALPGTLQEKFDPYLMPLMDKLDELIYPDDSLQLRNDKRVDSVPINFLRGANWLDKIVILDEAQNFTFKELTTAITRISHGTKLFICGDFMQSDIGAKSGFRQMMKLFDDDESMGNGIRTFSFTHDDIVRSGVLKFIAARIEKSQPPSY